MESHDQQKQYWAEMVKLKVASLYIRCYRDHLGGWVTRVATIRAIASSVSIAGWALWRNASFVWASIIAATQIADALKDVFPFAKQHKAASELAATLENLFIDAQLEWDNIFSGKYSNEEIIKRLHKLRTLAPHAEQRSFPTGLAERPGLLALAKSDAKTYFSETYGVQV